MIYFDSDMSKSTNTVVYFDWKTVIYIYVCRKCRTQCMLPMESQSHSPVCANAHLLTKRKKEVMLELTTIDANNVTVILSQCMLSCIDLLVYLLSTIIKLFGCQYFEFERT